MLRTILENVDGLLIAVGHSVVALLELPTRPRLHVTVHNLQMYGVGVVLCIIYDVRE